MPLDGVVHNIHLPSIEHHWYKWHSYRNESKIVWSLSTPCLFSKGAPLSPCIVALSRSLSWPRRDNICRLVLKPVQNNIEGAFLAHKTQKTQLWNSFGLYLAQYNSPMLLLLRSHWTISPAHVFQWHFPNFRCLPEKKFAYRIFYILPQRVD